MVEDVLPRRSQLGEPAVANVDHVLLVFSGALPAFQPPPATRYLLSADAAGLPVTVAINKADLLGEAEAEALVQQVWVWVCLTVVGVMVVGGRGGRGGRGAGVAGGVIVRRCRTPRGLRTPHQPLAPCAPLLHPAQICGWGYHALAVSVVTGRGLGELEAALRGRVTVVAGPSGAGKSSIINALRLRSAGLEASLDAMAAQPSGAGCHDDEEEEEAGQGHEERQLNGDGGEAPNMAAAALQARQDLSQPASLPPELELQAVGQVSERIGRGKHTTRNVTLLELGGGGGGGGGLVVDTPGFNQPDLAGIPSAQLWQHFPEVQQLLQEGRWAAGVPRLGLAAAQLPAVRAGACRCRPRAVLSPTRSHPARIAGAPSAAASTCRSRGAWCGRRGGSGTRCTARYTRS
jgi:putative ribosome biogenesis GTPase RsgA